MGPAYKHGAYSALKLTARAEELAGVIRERLPVYSEVDEFAVSLCALALARAERGALVLAEAEESGGLLPEKLEQNVRGWTSTARRLLQDLGGSPRARAELAAALGVTGAEVARRQLEAHLVERYGGGGEVGS